MQKENDATFGLEARGEENGEEVPTPLFIRFWGLVECRELFQRSAGGAPAKNGFLL